MENGPQSASSLQKALKHEEELQDQVSNDSEGQEFEANSTDQNGNQCHLQTTGRQCLFKKMMYTF